ncbi:MAG TPA: gas vesicle protein K [Candidatus Nitrosotalea sp.]|nr:gas vesicle protein K [Candidatus Nitrosotalea sp.]
MISELQPRESGAAQQINFDGEKIQKGLAKLVLVVVELLRQILERQAQRRMQSGSLTTEEVERLGLAFMQIKEKMSYISEEFGLKQEELDGVLNGMLRSPDSQMARTSLVDVVDRLLSKGAVIGGRITISVADVELVALDLLASLSGLPETGKKGTKMHDS